MLRLTTLVTSVLILAGCSQGVGTGSVQLGEGAPEATDIEVVAPPELPSNSTVVQSEPPSAPSQGGPAPRPSDSSLERRDPGAWAQEVCEGPGLAAAEAYGSTEGTVSAHPTTVTELRDWNQERIRSSGGPDVTTSILSEVANGHTVVALCSFTGLYPYFPSGPGQSNPYDTLTLAIAEDGTYEVVAASISEVADPVTADSTPSPPPPSDTPTEVPAANEVHENAGPE